MSDFVHVIRATIDPSSAPTREGQHWVNTVTKKMWLSVGIATVADWILIANFAIPNVKAGRLLVSDFSGTPLKATVTFGTFIGPPYAVNVSGVDVRVWTIDSYTSTGFVVNSNAALNLTGDVFWEVIQDGEF